MILHDYMTTFFIARRFHDRAKEEESPGSMSLLSAEFNDLEEDEAPVKASVTGQKRKRVQDAPAVDNKSKPKNPRGGLASSLKTMVGNASGSQNNCMMMQISTCQR